MVTTIEEVICFFSLETSSGKQRKARSKSRPQFFNENSLEMTEADQFSLAPQQLASSSNFNNSSNNFNRYSKLSNSLTTTLPKDWKTGKFEIFEALFQTGLKIYIQLTREDKVKSFHSFMRGCRPSKTSTAQPEGNWEKSLLSSVGNTCNLSHGLQRNIKING